MTDEGRMTGRLQGAGRCATCFESFNPACPRAVLDEASRVVPRPISTRLGSVVKPRSSGLSRCGYGLMRRLLAR
ncbi:hypothetical protein ABWK57_34970, partial [Streptomyces sp. NPDC094045]|uniref:hypothetical protein n=1 Tax=Streptomyces sp. NPDC094045 TaxID=3161019 RepID=UPI00339A732C